MGIRKKIILGFLLIGFLLLMSGILSSIELAKLNMNTANELNDYKEILTLSEELLHAAEQKNTSFLQSLEDSLDVYDSIFLVSDQEFDKTILLLTAKEKDVGYLQRIKAANSRYNDLLKNRDKVSIEWLVNVYSKSYSRVTSSIEDYLVARQNSFQKYTEILEGNVYRALMVGIISLSAGLLLLAAFYFMIHSFFLSPVLKMEKAIRDFLKANIPYSIKIETKDEINSLSDSISELCTRARKKML